MRAKYILNEIKKGSDNIMGDLNVGKTMLFPVYQYFKKNKPQKLSQTVKNFLQNYKNVKDIRAQFALIAIKLNTALDRMYWIPNYEFTNLEEEDFYNYSETNFLFIDKLRYKYSKTDSYDSAHASIDFYGISENELYYAEYIYEETVGESFNQYEKNEIRGYCVPFN